ncbi:MAG: hypothetical protein M9883_14735 [Methylobacteriaceae bacterium]|nr:DUF1049 domain-containing protein [Methylobacteriaceae bacterium]MCO5088104.1 hypothetical protein [Methylobacteriaceae bacterium]
MRTLFRLLVVLPVAILIVLFAVANRHLVMVSFDPFPGNDIQGPQLTAPLFLLLFLAGALGVLAGGMTVWFRQGRFRKQAREAKAEAAEARGRAEDMREKVDRMERASLAALPPSGRNAA